jgi:hypothetical protein
MTTMVMGRAVAVVLAVVCIFAAVGIGAEVAVLVEHRVGETGEWTKRCEVSVGTSERGRVTATIVGGSGAQATVDAAEAL